MRHIRRPLIAAAIVAALAVNLAAALVRHLDERDLARRAAFTGALHLTAVGWLSGALTLLAPALLMLALGMGSVTAVRRGIADMKEGS